jgi:mRNA interferase RelE/StbE
MTKYLAQYPVKLGKPLKEDLAGLFRYCFGDYRIMYIVDIPAEMITILNVRYKKDIYR